MSVLFFLSLSLPFPVSLILSLFLLPLSAFASVSPRNSPVYTRYFVSVVVFFFIEDCFCRVRHFCLILALIMWCHEKMTRTKNKSVPSAKRTGIIQSIWYQQQQQQQQLIYKKRWRRFVVVKTRPKNECGRNIYILQSYSLYMKKKTPSSFRASQTNDFDMNVPLVWICEWENFLLLPIWIRRIFVWEWGRDVG